jgi:hypothetical protein
MGGVLGVLVVVGVVVGVVVVVIGAAWMSVAVPEGAGRPWCRSR